MEKAGIALRFVAVLIDGVVLFAGAFVIALATGGGYAESSNGTSSAGFNLDGGPFLFWTALALAYYVVLEAMSGATIGKKVVGIRVVDEDGSPIAWRASLVRNLLRLVDGLFFYLVGALFASRSPRGQRIGDRAARTLVVRS